MKKNNENMLGLGTAAIGRPTYINIKKDGNKEDFSLGAFEQKGIQILNSSYDKGIRYYDTAPGYGMAEKMLENWVQAKNDPTIEIATKWGYTYVANFDEDAIQHEVKSHTIEKLNEQWEHSKNLLPNLTTYQIHSATLDTKVLENVEILNRLAEIKNDHSLYIGLTTSGNNQMEVLKKALDIEINGISLFDVFQVTYNIFDQSIAVIADEMNNRNKRLVIKEALANGRVFSNESFPNYSLHYKVLERLAIKYDVGIDAIALRFCLDSIPVHNVLSGASSEEHLTGNIKIENFRLDMEDVELLKNLAVDPILYWNERKQLVWN